MGYAKKDVFLRKVWVQANDIEVGDEHFERKFMTASCGKISSLSSTRSIRVGYKLSL